MAVLKQENVDWIIIRGLMNSERTVHKQLIDDERNFHRDAVESVARVLGAVDKQYFTVAIIGVQNSGKSTLLNKVFGTNFDVLKELAGSRTTRGILTSVDKTENIIILDVEGNDAMDRSEEQDYEKMVATYALVTANVLIINIWSKSLGQYTGSQYETLKVIMDICMGQFKQDSPKTILYCVRDFNEEFDDEGEIRRKILRDVNDLWRKLEKPQELKAYDTRPEKLFNVEVVVIGKYRPGKQGKFDEDTGKLREKFVNPKADGYVFAHQKTQFNLPISDLPQLSENAWISIKTNQKLNLPSEKEQLASFRCSSIMNEIQSSFEQEMGSLEAEGLVADYGKLKDKYLEEYDQKTYHYGKQVTDSKRSELESGIDEHLKKTINQKVNVEINELVEGFVQESKNQNEHTSKGSLDEELRKLMIHQIEQLVGFMKKLGYEVPGRKEKIEELSQKLSQKFEDIKKTIIKISADEFQNESSRTVRLLASEVLKNHFGQDFWKQATEQFDSRVAGIIEKYRIKYTWITGEEINPVEYDMIQEKISLEYKEAIKSELEKTLVTRMVEHFNQLYLHDKDGGRINFNLMTEEEIGEHFDSTRDKVILLIRKLNELNGSRVTRSSFLEGMDQDHSFFESTWLSNVTEQIDKSMRNEFEKTIRRKKEGEMNHVPWWLYAIIIYFVYDDLWFSEEETPLLHYILVVLLIIPTFLLSIGQGKVLQESIRIVMDRLKEKLPFLR